MTVPAETRHQHLLTDVDSKQPDRRGHALTSNSLEACVSFVSSTDAVLIHTNLLTEFYESRNLERILVAEGEQPDRWLLGIYVLRERRRDPWVVKIIHFIKEKSKELDLLDAQA